MKSKKQSAITHPYVTQNEKVSKGRPIIKGTRIRILDAVIEYEYLGWSPDRIIEAHPQRTLPKVHDALSFYYENREGIDREIQSRKDRISELERKNIAPIHQNEC